MKHKPATNHLLLCVLLFSSTTLHPLGEAWGQILAGIIGTVGIVTTFFKKDVKALHYVTKALHEPEVLDYLHGEQKKQPGKKMDFHQAKMGYLYFRNAQSYNQILGNVRTAVQVRDNPLTINLAAFALQRAYAQPDNPDTEAKIQLYYSNTSKITQQKVENAVAAQQQAAEQIAQATSSGVFNILESWAGYTSDPKLKEEENIRRMEDRLNYLFSSPTAQNYRQRLKEETTSANHYGSQHKSYRSEQLMRIKQGNQDGFSFSNDLDRIK